MVSLKQRNKCIHNKPNTPFFRYRVLFVISIFSYYFINRDQTHHICLKDINLIFVFHSDNTTTPIAFSAYVDVIRSYNHHYVVIFDKITTNLGQSYNPDNGIFICPFSGVYIFSLTTLSREYHYMGGSITIESRTLGSTWGEDDRDNIEAQGSVTVVSECFPGQRVWVRTLADDMEMYGDTNGWYSVFSGLLFHAY